MRLCRVPSQTSLCAGCGLQITERKRKPCPRCKGMNRSITATATDIIAMSDRVS